MLDSFMNNLVTLIRDGQPREAWACVQGTKMYGPISIDVKRGDIVRWMDFSEDHVVTKVEPFREPGGESGGMGHKKITLMPKSEWDERQRAGEHTSITQNIATAGVVAGRDIPVTVNVTVTQILEAVQQQIEHDPNIPEADKRSLVENLKELATNPYVAGLSTAAIWDSIKGLLGG